MNKSRISNPEILLNIFLVLFTLSFFISALYVNIYYQGNPFSASNTLRKIHFKSAKSLEKTKAAVQITKYVWGKGNSRSLKNVSVANQSLSPSEIAHLRDVRMLFSKISKAGLTATSLMVFFAVIIYLTNSAKLVNGLFWNGTVLLLFVLLTGILGSFDFGKLFNYLHSPFFQKNTWVFPEDSILIQLFPLNFWELIIRRVILMIFTESVILMSFIFILRKKLTEKH